MLSVPQRRDWHLDLSLEQSKCSWFQLAFDFVLGTELVGSGYKATSFSIPGVGKQKGEDRLRRNVSCFSKACLGRRLSPTKAPALSLTL